MKKIRVLTLEPVVIASMTLDPNNPMPVWNEEILKSKEVMHLLSRGKIEILDDEADKANKNNED